MLGISPASVSLVLNNKPGVSEVTRNRVINAVKELGCEELISDTGKNQQHILFLVYRKNDAGNEKTSYFSQIFSDIIEGVESQAKVSGYKLSIAYADRLSIKEEVERIKSESVEGILLLATEMQEKHMELFSDIHVPTVIIDNYMESEDIDCVAINNEQGVELAVSYLVSMGHRDIGYLHVDGNANNFIERYYGFMRSTDKHKLIISQENIIGFSTSGGDAVYWELKGRLQALRKVPTAFFADNDIIAICAIRVLREMGYRIPEDISIVGFDNIALTELMDPPLTTIRTSKHAIGSGAVNALVGKLSGITEGVLKIEIKSDLVVRSSVKNLYM